MRTISILIVVVVVAATVSAVKEKPAAKASTAVTKPAEGGQKEGFMHKLVKWAIWTINHGTKLSDLILMIVKVLKEGLGHLPGVDLSKIEDPKREAPKNEAPKPAEQGKGKAPGANEPKPNGEEGEEPQPPAPGPAPTKTGGLGGLPKVPSVQP